MPHGIVPRASVMEKSENIVGMGLLERTRSFGRMIRFSHSIFALPFALVALLVVLDQHPVVFSTLDLLLLLVCMVSARTAAMGFNRIVDRDVDARNPRTQGRELPSGAVGLREAWIFTITAAVVFVVASFGINLLCGILSIPLLALLLGYSLTKRYTWGSHFVLGLCLGAAPIGVWFALTGSFDWAPILLGAGVTFWTAGFDVYYSLQDEEFDREYGLRSIPARFGGRRSIVLVRVIHLIAALCFVGFGIVAGMGLPFWIGLTFVLAILVWEAWLLRRGDLSKIDLAFFNLNGYVSILFAAATAIDLWLL